MRKGYFVDTIAKCIMCGMRFWEKPFPSKCTKCGGATTFDVAKGVW